MNKRLLVLLVVLGLAIRVWRRLQREAAEEKPAPLRVPTVGRIWRTSPAEEAHYRDVFREPVGMVRGSADPGKGGCDDYVQ